MLNADEDEDEDDDENDDGDEDEGEDGSFGDRDVMVEDTDDGDDERSGDGEANALTASNAGPAFTHQPAPLQQHEGELPSSVDRSSDAGDGEAVGVVVDVEARVSELMAKFEWKPDVAPPLPRPIAAQPAYADLPAARQPSCPLTGPPVQSKQKPGRPRKTKYPLPMKECKCQKGTCYRSLPEEVLKCTREQAALRTEDQRTHIIHGILMAGLSCSDFTPRRKRKKDPSRTTELKLRQRVKYRFMGVELCQIGVMNVLGCGRSIISATLKRFKERQFFPPPSQRGKALNMRTRHQRLQVVRFITNVAYKEGLPNPAGRGARVLLPITYTRKVMYKKYSAPIKEHNGESTCQHSTHPCPASPPLSPLTVVLACTIHRSGGEKEGGGFKESQAAAAAAAATGGGEGHGHLRGRPRRRAVSRCRVHPGLEGVCFL